MRRAVLLFATVAFLVAPEALAVGAVASSSGLVSTVSGAMPLLTLLQGVAKSGGFDVVALPGVPDTQISLNITARPWRSVFDSLVSGYGLASCQQDGVLYVGSNDAVNRVCPLALPVAGTSSTGTSTVATSAASAAGPVVAVPPARYAVRVSIIEIADNSGVSGGVDWSAGLLPGLLGAGLAVATGSPLALDASGLAKSVSALERQGVAKKLDEVNLNLSDGLLTTFQSGGTLQLSLVGGGTGGGTIERTLPYGLTIGLTPHAQGDQVSVAASVDLSSPVSTSNTALLDVARRSVSSVVVVDGQHSAVVASYGSTRDERSGSGLPGLDRVPGVGYLAGTSSSSASRSTIVITLSLVGRSVAAPVGAL